MTKSSTDIVSYRRATCVKFKTSQIWKAFVSLHTVGAKQEQEDRLLKDIRTEKVPRAQSTGIE